MDTVVLWFYLGIVVALTAVVFLIIYLYKLWLGTESIGLSKEFEEFLQKTRARRAQVSIRNKIFEYENTIANSTNERQKEEANNALIRDAALLKEYDSLYGEVQDSTTFVPTDFKHETRTEDLYNLYNSSSPIEIECADSEPALLNLDFHSYDQKEKAAIKRISLNRIERNSFIQSANIDKLILKSFKDILVLRNCNINELIFEFGANKVVYLENCKCGKISFTSNNPEENFNTLELNNCEIGDIYCQKNNSLYVNYLHILNSKLFGDKIVDIRAHIQSYRNLLLCVNTKNDNVTSREIQAEILRMERCQEVDKGFNTRFIRSIGRFYDHVSGYGTRPAKCLKFLGLLTLFSFFLIWSNSAVVLSSDFSSKCGQSKIRGWQKGLCGKGYLSSAYQAAILSVRPLVNPLGYFQNTNKLVPRYFWVNIWLFVQWLLTVIVIFLFVISLRGRFKIS